MTNWISFDLDYATGDCRNFDLGKDYCCVKQCSGCGNGTVGRGEESGYPYPHARFASVRDKLLKMKITDVIVRDSHGDIAQFLEEGDWVLHLDYHGDDEVCDGDMPSCYDWVSWAEDRNIVVDHIPSEDSIPYGEYRMFVAVSRPYTRATVDADLFALLMDLQVPVNLYGGA